MSFEIKNPGLFAAIGIPVATMKIVLYRFFGFNVLSLLAGGALTIGGIATYNHYSKSEDTQPAEPKKAVKQLPLKDNNNVTIETPHVPNHSKDKKLVR